jgi:hypothetical protein
MEEVMQFPLKQNPVKLGTVLIEIVLSGDSLSSSLTSKSNFLVKTGSKTLTQVSM